MRRWIEDGVTVLALSALVGFAVGAAGGVPVPLWQRCLMTSPWTLLWMRARMNGGR